MNEPADIRPVPVPPTWDAARIMAEAEDIPFIECGRRCFGGRLDTGTGAAS